MRVVRPNLFAFCRQQSIHHDKYFSDIPRLKRTLQKEHFFVRKHYQEFGIEIQRCIMSKDWQVLKNGLKCINTGELDSWLVLRKIGLAFTKTLNTLSLKKVKAVQVQNLLTCLSQLKYQPIPKTAENQYPYDDIAHFSQQISNYVSEVPYFKRKEHYLELMYKMLHTNPQLFEPLKTKVEDYIINNIDLLLLRGKYYFTHLITSGIISNYWSEQFRHRFANKAKEIDQVGLIQAFYLQDMTFPNEVSPNNTPNKVKTEEQIVNILEGYGYNIQPNVNINRFEVDVLISDYLVVEYNGHHHYVINSEQLVPTLKHKWKNQLLRKRGYVISSISYPEWKKIHLFEQKRKFLVNKIENDLLAHYFP